MIFFFHDPATTGIYTYGHSLSLHDALPIWRLLPCRADTRHFGQRACSHGLASLRTMGPDGETVRLVTQALQVEENGVVHWQSQFAPIHQDRKSTRLNSSH